MEPTPSVPTPPPDTSLAEDTVRHLGKLLKRSQFALKHSTRERRTAQRTEVLARSRVKGLVKRIALEFDRHPGLFQRYGIQRPRDDS